MDGLLEITTLGTLVIRQTEEPVQLNSRKAEALLVYLGRCKVAQSRLWLAELLWPERSQKQALANLRTLLSRLRPQLGSCLLVTRDTVALETSAYRLDANTFEQILSSKSWESPQAVLSEEQALWVEEAVALYSGSFLETFYLGAAPDFEDWVAQEREKFQHLVGTAFEGLADYYARQQDYSLAINRLNRLLQIEPFHEQAHRQMLRLLTQHGQRRVALDHYTSYQRYLFRELDIAPEAETTDLYEAIKVGKFLSLHLEGPPEIPPTRIAPLSTTEAERIHQLGRVSLFTGTPSDLLAQIAELLQEVQFGKNETIFEKGQPGSCMYIVIEGQVRIHDGNHTLNRLSSRDIFGEMALLDASPRLAAATTLSAVRLWQLEQSTLYGLMEKRIEVAQGIIRVLLGWLRERVGEVVQLNSQLQDPNSSPKDKERK